MEHIAGIAVGLAIILGISLYKANNKNMRIGYFLNLHRKRCFNNSDVCNCKDCFDNDCEHK